MENTPSIINGRDLIYSDSTNVKNELSAPAGLIDSVNNIIMENMKEKKFSLNKDKIDELWKVTIKPDFQNGIESGSLNIQKGTLEIRNAKNGQYVGKAKLNEVRAEELIKNKPSALSTITGGIASISGQLQLAEISKKLDVINEKIDQIGRFLWREKVSKLQSIQIVIEDAIESLPNKFALERINDCIKDLQHLSVFIEKTIEEILSRKIEYKLMPNFLEGLKVWEWGNKSRTEYNNKYNDEIRLFINEYGFLLDLYFQTLGLLGTCYQITNEYQQASKYFKKIESKIIDYADELFSKLIYLLNVDGISIDDDLSLLHISESLKNRKLPEMIMEEINLSSDRVDEVKKMHKGLVSQFEEIQISYNVDSQLLIGGLNND